LCFLGGAFEGLAEHISPFGYKRGEGIDAGSGEVEWICGRDRPRTDPMFEALSPIDGKISGAGKNENLERNDRKILTFHGFSGEI
jgi:EH domain-containing protein 1